MLNLHKTLSYSLTLTTLFPLFIFTYISALFLLCLAEIYHNSLVFNYQKLIKILNNIPGNGANVGALSHPRLAIGSMVLTNNRGFNPLSIQRHSPNR